MILLGSLLLTLPAAASGNERVGWFDALFTSASAVCVTGLVAVDTGTAYSRFGHVVLLCLIQVGGLGFMTFATLILRFLGKQLTLKERLIVRESINEDRMSGLSQTVQWIAVSTLMIELTGAVLLSFRFVPLLDWSDGLFYALFHSVSAFCNAGFDLFGNYSSLTGFAGDVPVNLTVMALVILGGLGFAVLDDLRRRRLRLHTKVVLSTYGALFIFGYLFVLMTEWNNPATLGPMGAGEKLLAAAFQSVTLRTAGFNTIDQASLLPVTKLVGCILMGVGAAPASTGGGVKVTTFAVLILLVRMVARGESSINVFHRRLERTMVQRAVAIAMIAAGVVLADVIAISLLEPGMDLLDIAYECASAMGTVGISAAGTPNMRLASKLILLITMYLGRIGPLTMALLLAKRQASSKENYRWPEDRVMIG
ncbi:MAG: Trk family potassium uptake protein [Clostridia bacterium]|nr:Trk family potassium uptake protein [Clostridia bacterium]